MTSSPLLPLKQLYCNGGNFEVAQGAGGPAGPPTAAESTRMTPVSSMQYDAVPVDGVSGPVLTEKPVQRPVFSSPRTLQKDVTVHEQENTTVDFTLSEK